MILRNNTQRCIFRHLDNFLNNLWTKACFPFTLCIFSYIVHFGLLGTNFVLYMSMFHFGPGISDRGFCVYLKCT